MSGIWQHYPWSIERLVRHAKTWSFDSEVDQLCEDDGEPFSARAIRRVQGVMRAWRDRHGPEGDPLFDNGFASFHVNDVAALVYECTRLSVLEEKVIRALGPPSKRMRYDTKLGKLVEDKGAPDDT
jgi:hypothetical protein